MFEYLDEHDNEYGSEERYQSRGQVHKDAYGDRKRYLLWWLIHNCVAHPLIGFFPTRRMFDLHDWTSARINAKEKKGAVAEALAPSTKEILRLLRKTHDLLGEDSRFGVKTLQAAIRQNGLWHYWREPGSLDAELKGLHERGFIHYDGKNRASLTGTGWGITEALGPTG